MNIYVGNLPPDITEQELGLEFAAFGEVTFVVIMADKYTGTGLRKHAFVEMASKSQGTAAVAALKGKNLREWPIDVVEALPLSEKKTAIAGHQRGGASGTRGRAGRH